MFSPSHDPRVVSRTSRSASSYCSDPSWCGSPIPQGQQEALLDSPASIAGDFSTTCDAVSNFRRASRGFSRCATTASWPRQMRACGSPDVAAPPHCHHLHTEADRRRDPPDAPGEVRQRRTAEGDISSHPWAATGSGGAEDEGRRGDSWRAGKTRHAPPPPHRRHGARRPRARRPRGRVELRLTAARTAAPPNAYCRRAAANRRAGRRSHDRRTAGAQRGATALRSGLRYSASPGEFARAALPHEQMAGGRREAADDVADPVRPWPAPQARGAKARRVASTASAPRACGAAGQNYLA